MSLAINASDIISITQGYEDQDAEADEDAEASDDDGDASFGDDE